MSEEMLTELERRSLELLLSAVNCADPAIRGQLDHVRVKKREYTGVGCFINLDVPNQYVAQDKSRVVISNLSGEMSGLNNGFGGVLYIEDGKLTALEFFTYDEQWPVEPGGFMLQLEKRQSD